MVNMKSSTLSHEAIYEISSENNFCIIEDSLITSINQDNNEDNSEQPIKTKRKNKRNFLFCVMSGNHPKQVRIGFDNRPNWTEMSGKESFSKANFIWKPTNFKFQDYMRIDETLKRGIKLVINHLDKINGIGTKTTLITSLKEYYKKSNEALFCGYHVFDTTPTSFLMTPVQDKHDFYARFTELSK